MINKASLYIFFIVVVFGCAKPTNSILAFCEEDEKGDYTIKWEVSPEQDNADVSIYASDNDTVFPSVPVLTTSVNNYIAILNHSDSLKYRYFRLKLKGDMSDIISTRFYSFDSIMNFRDLGGYRTQEGKIVRWGRMFRSGSFAYASYKDLDKLSKLGLKTIVDMRPAAVIARRPDLFKVGNNIDLPVTLHAYDQISQQVIEGRFYKGDAIIFTQDLYKEIVTNYTDSYKTFFDILLDESNYPLVFHCTMGKDQTGIAAYFLLRALDVSSDIAEDDYAFSNFGIDKNKLSMRVDTLSESKQEALTMLTRTDPAYLRYAISCIRQQYGSVGDYMTKELGLTESKKQRLRQILLYN